MEMLNPVGPRGVYDEAKGIRSFNYSLSKNSKGLNIRIVRIFNTYGPRMRINDGRAIPNLINQSLNNLDLQYMVMVLKHDHSVI